MATGSWMRRSPTAARVAGFALGAAATVCASVAPAARADDPAKPAPPAPAQPEALPVPSGLILQIGSRFRYELTETLRTSTRDVGKGASGSPAREVRSEMTWTVAMEVTDSGPDGATVAVTIERIRGKLTRDRASRTFDWTKPAEKQDEKPAENDGEKPLEKTGLEAIVGRASDVRIDARGRVLDVAGAAADLVDARFRDIPSIVRKETIPLFQRFFQTLPEADVPVAGKWTAPLEFDVWDVEDGRWPLLEVEETRVVKAVEGDAASLVLTSHGMEKSPRSLHAAGKRGDEPNVGKARESWQWNGTASVDARLGLTRARSGRMKCTTYLWILGGSKDRCSLTTVDLSTDLRLTDIAMPERKRPGND